ncbi:MAG: PEP-CTERM sorting domain-containing protein [Planctomycetota bacterium]|jgi:hypothetical protein
MKNYKMKRTVVLIVSVVLLLPGMGREAGAAIIKVIDQGVSGHSKVAAARNHLIALGHTVTTGGTLTDYSAFDQVWDLRYSANLGASDITAMGNYLVGGGRMYLTGEHSYFDSSRNTSLVNWTSSVGGGSLILASTSAGGSQPITAAGQIVNSPNLFASVAYSAARTTASAGNGFLVTETSLGSGEGSLVGWDFGDIIGKPGARMLIGFDIEIFQNGQNWTENMATYLAAPVPEPGTMMLLGLGGLVLRRKR